MVKTFNVVRAMAEVDALSSTVIKIKWCGSVVGFMWKCSTVINIKRV